MKHDEYPTDVAALTQSHGGPLVCHGCAHSASSYAYPGRPSGERPCCFCVRNVQREQWVAEMPENMQANYGKSWTAFYNNAPMKKCPMDCYITLDRLSNDLPPGSVAIT